MNIGDLSDFINFKGLDDDCAIFVRVGSEEVSLNCFIVENDKKLILTSDEGSDLVKCSCLTCNKYDCGVCEYYTVCVNTDYCCSEWEYAYEE